MKLKNNTALFTIYVGIIIYTVFGIFQLEARSGSLFSVFTVVSLLSFLLVCVLLLAVVLFTKKLNFKKKVIFTVISLLIWTYGVYKLWDHPHVAYPFMYLGPFELFNIFLLLFFIKQATRQNNSRNI